jgi:hypothetical protein
MNKLLTEIKQHQCIFYITLIMSFLIAIKVNFLKKFDSKPEPGLFKKIFMDVSAGKEVPHAYTCPICVVILFIFSNK